MASQYDSTAADHASKALELAEAGVPCFPVRLGEPDEDGQRKKRPLTKRGHLDASADTAQVEQWWRDHPDAVPGVPTGEVSGVVAVDVDPPGEQWAAAHVDWLATAGRVHYTARGKHYLFRHVDGARCSAGLIAEGVDIRAGGGWLLWWPALGYAAVGDLDELAPPPEPLAGLLRDPKGGRTQPTGATPSNAHTVATAPHGGIIVEGGRNDALARYAGALRRQGLDGEAIASALLGINDQRCSPPLAAEEVRKIAEGMERYAPGEELAAAGPSRLPEPLDMRRALTEDAPPIRWLIRDRLELGRGAALTGIGGSAKTRALFHVAAGVAIGRMPWPWGKVDHPGRAVLLLSEDTYESAWRKAKSLADGLHLEPDEHNALAERLELVPMAGRDARLLVRSAGALVQSGLFAHLAERAQGASLIGIDPALAVSDGDEMDQGEQRRLGETVERLAIDTGAAALLVTHAAKGSIQADEIDGHQSRGAGALTDALRAEYVMRTMTAREAPKAGVTDRAERKRHKQLVASKGNDLPPEAFEPVWLRIDEAAVLKPASVTFAEQGKGLSAKQSHALAILQRMHAERARNLAAGGVDSKPRVELKEWRQALRDEDVSQSRETLRRIPKALEERGEVEIDEAGFVWPTAEE